MHLFLLVASTVLAVISPISYVVSIVRGTSRPHRITRFALSVVLLLNFVSILQADGNMSAQLLAGVFAVQAVLIFLLSLWRGTGGKSRSDWLCLIVVGVGIAGWQLTGNPVIGIWFSVLADCAAYVPTLIKTWRDPMSEEHWTYTCSIAAASLGLLADQLSVASVFQIYIVCIDALMVLCIYHKKLTAWVVKRYTLQEDEMV